MVLFGGKSEVIAETLHLQLQIIVASDAKEYGIGAITDHKFEDDMVKAVVYASRI